jgi:hypothetical protein
MLCLRTNGQTSYTHGSVVWKLVADRYLNAGAAEQTNKHASQHGRASVAEAGASKQTNKRSRASSTIGRQAAVTDASYSGRCPTGHNRAVDTPLKLPLVNAEHVGVELCCWSLARLMV